MVLHGCDVSTFQATMDLSGYDFVIIKSSEGINYQDEGMERHVQSALSTNTPFGFYHYARPDLGNTGAQEAASMLQYISPYIGQCVIALDWEQNSLSYPISWIEEFLNYILDKTGVHALLYIQANQATQSKYAPIANAGFGLWVAHWGVEEPSFSNWNTWSVWQYTDTPIDLDYFNGTVEDWNALAGGGVQLEWIYGNRYLSQSEMENNARLVWNYFGSLGWTLNAVAGMLGNMQRESTINPGIWQNLDPSQPSVLGYGLVGWTPGTRITNWLTSHGYELTSGEGQCAKIKEEWQHPEIEVVWITTDEYPETFNEFVSSHESPEYLASCFLYNYERAGVAAEDERRKNARKWYNFLSSSQIYVPRLDSDGIEGNPMWYDENPFYQSGYGVPNCTAYCWGRWYELLGEPPDLPLGDGNSWFPTAQEMGVYDTGAYPGSEPALGAIICTYYDIGGHVAVVEQINEDGSIVTSNSGWQSTYFWIETLYPEKGYVPSWADPGAYVQGFIYLPISYGPGPGPGPEPPEPEPPTYPSSRNFIYYLRNPWLRFLR